jgi:hypothetical protein
MRPVLLALRASHRHRPQHRPVPVHGLTWPDRAFDHPDMAVNSHGSDGRERGSPIV